MTYNAQYILISCHLHAAPISGPHAPLHRAGFIRGSMHNYSFLPATNNLAAVWFINECRLFYEPYAFVFVVLYRG